MRGGNLWGVAQMNKCVILSQEDYEAVLCLLNDTKVNLSKISCSYFQSEVKIRLEEVEKILTKGVTHDSDLLGRRW